MPPGRASGGLALLVVSAVAFALLGLLARAAYAGGASPFGLVLIRYTVAVVTLLPVAVLAGAPLRQPGARTAALLALGLLYAVGAYGIFVGLERLPVGTAILVLYTYPAWVIALGAFLGERPSARRLVALALALIGLLLTVGFHPEALDLLGVAAVLGAAVSTAVVVLAVGRLTPRVPSLVVTTYLLGGAAAVALLVGLLGGVSMALTVSGWAAAMAIGVVCTVVANLTLVAGVARLGPSRAAIVGTLEPVFAVLLAALALGERLAFGQLVGGALIVGAVLLAALPERAAAAAPAPRPAAGG